jgi:hypothetical protein
MIPSKRVLAGFHPAPHEGSSPSTPQGAMPLDPGIGLSAMRSNQRRTETYLFHGGLGLRVLFSAAGGLVSRTSDVSSGPRGTFFSHTRCRVRSARSLVNLTRAGLGSHAVFFDFYARLHQVRAAHFQSPHGPVSRPCDASSGLVRPIVNLTRPFVRSTRSFVSRTRFLFNHTRCYVRSTRCFCKPHDAASGPRDARSTMCAFW